MKVVSLVLALLLTIAAAQEATSIAQEFRGIKWRQYFEKAPKTLEFAFEGPLTQYFARPDDRLSIGQTQVDGVLYGFYNNQFTEALAIFKDADKVQPLLNTLTAEYGRPREESDKATVRYLWSMPLVSIELAYGSDAGMGSVNYFNNALRTQRWRDLGSPDTPVGR